MSSGPDHGQNASGKTDPALPLYFAAPVTPHPRQQAPLPHAKASNPACFGGGRSAAVGRCVEWS